MGTAVSFPMSCLESAARLQSWLVRRAGRPGLGALLVLATLAGTGPAALAGAGEAFPRPAELERDVRFWTRVFTEVDTGGGFLHDDRRLDIVYETLRFEPGLGDPGEREQARAAVGRYREALRALASGKRTDLSPEETRALAAWGAQAGEQTLREAAERVRFQRGQADKFREGYVRAGKWRGHIERTLRSQGLPAELAALPHVESSYNPAARSHAGAAGLWQFTVPTGKRFLRIDRRVDERLDPYRSTEAAARLLKHNHKVTGSWPLALTAYNHGAGGVMRAVRAMGTDDIVAIVRGYDGPAFGFASRNFYVSFLAALDVDRNAASHFGPLQLARASAAPAPSSERASASAERPRAKASVRKHRVRPGETVSGIAARYGVSHQQLMAMNGLRRPRELQAGQVLRVPASDS
jgi:membrane-bound lytic murein transglycosylase D